MNYQFEHFMKYFLITYDWKAKIETTMMLLLTSVSVKHQNISWVTEQSWIKLTESNYEICIYNWITYRASVIQDGCHSKLTIKKGFNLSQFYKYWHKIWCNWGWNCISIKYSSIMRLYKIKMLLFTIWSQFS